MDFLSCHLTQLYVHVQWHYIHANCDATIAAIHLPDSFHLTKLKLSTYEAAAGISLPSLATTLSLSRNLTTLDSSY